jgi:hypothetical protein
MDAQSRVSLVKSWLVPLVLMRRVATLHIIDMGYGYWLTADSAYNVTGSRLLSDRSKS